MRIFFIILLVCFSYLLKAQTNILYFECERKGKIYYSWEVQTNKKELTYIIQASNTKNNFIDLINYKSKHKKHIISILNDFIYFRLKIITDKDCFIYSDIIYVRNQQPIEAYPDKHGHNVLYVNSLESGICHFYNKKNEIVLIQNITEGYNQVCYNLAIGEYDAQISTQNYYYEIKIFVR